MPDVALSAGYAPLDWVGMRGIELPVLWRGLQVPSRVEARVSLDKKDSRGIHMSRLFLTLQSQLAQSELTVEKLGQMTSEFLTSHADLSSQALVKVSFDAPLMRKALKTQNSAWRQYPTTISCEQNGTEKAYFVEVQVLYSSTCPASAALARQLIQKNFAEQFADKAPSASEMLEWLGSSEGIIATPHAQRSVGRVKVQVSADFALERLVDLIEDALQTPVQGAVKREDEQEFALRNGQNLMFCEDAARRLVKAFAQEKQILDFIAELDHQESLHPHNAVATVTAGKKLHCF